MISLEHANPASFVFLILLLGPVLYFIFKATKGALPFIRRIPGVDAIDEAIGRSVELGRPISFTSGLISVSPALYACLGTLHHVGQKSAIFNTQLFVPCSDPEVMVLSDATVQSAYRSVHRFSNYNPNDVRFISNEQFAYASGYMGLVHRENVGAAFLFGTFAAESLILAEAGQQVGAMQVAATVSNEQIPFFITSCDYTLIGEELFAAGAYLSKDPVQMGSLKGQDYAKLFIIILIVCGVIEATLSGIADPYKLKLTSLMAAEWSNFNDVMQSLGFRK